MYIYANIDDRSLVINDFLPQELFNKISTYNYEANRSSHEENVSDAWPEDLYKDKSRNVTMKKIMQVHNLAKIENGKITADDPIFEEFFKILTNCPFLPYKKNTRIILNYYEYSKFSGINWHTDHTYTLNYSFYIHENWDYNWGGETLIDTKRGLPLSVTPNPNSLVTIKNGTAHKVCCIGGPKKRRVLQLRGVFFKD